jgi:hypothetical protein
MAPWPEGAEPDGGPWAVTREAEHSKSAVKIDAPVRTFNVFIRLRVKRQLLADGIPQAFDATTKGFEPLQPKIFKFLTFFRKVEPLL